MTENAIRWYCVSSGDGNDGVSHSFPDYIVQTDKPWELARLALLSRFKPMAGQNWAKRHADIDGEADYTIYATLSNPPCEDTPDGEYPELSWHEDENAEDGRNWSDGNGAWLIIEVFAADSELCQTIAEGMCTVPTYEHPLMCFGPELMIVGE